MAAEILRFIHLWYENDEYSGFTGVHSDYCGRITQVFSQVFSKSFFLSMSHQITQTLTVSRLDAQLEQTRGIRLFTHTQQVDWSRQGESDCLIKQGILRFVVFCPMQCNPCVFVK